GGAGGEIVEGGAVLHEGDAAIGALKIVFMRGRAQIFLEQRPVGLEAGRVDVGNVVGNDIHLPFQRHLPRKSDEKHILHRWFSPLIDPKTGSPKPVVRICREPLGSPKPAGHASYSAKAVPSREVSVF